MDPPKTLVSGSKRVYSLSNRNSQRSQAPEGIVKPLAIWATLSLLYTLRRPEVVADTDLETLEMYKSKRIGKLNEDTTKINICISEWGMPSDIKAGIGGDSVWLNIVLNGMFVCL